MNELGNVNEIREKRIIELQEKVNKAYQSPRKEHLNWDRNSTREEIAVSRQASREFNAHPEDHSVRTLMYRDPPNAVTVEDSHEYAILIEMAVRKLYEEKNYNAKAIPGVVEKMLKHEYKHHVPGLGYDTFIMKYGVEYLEDTKHGFIGVRPFLILEGDVPVKVMNEVIADVDFASGSDKAWRLQEKFEKFKRKVKRR